MQDMFSEKFGKLEERNSELQREPFPYATNVQAASSMGTTGLSQIVPVEPL